MIVHRVPEGLRCWDVCVIGSGPVGLAAAFELERLGREVLLLESGALTRRRSGSDASRAFLVNGRTHAPMEIAVSRAFGGTSWMWGGRCVPLDDIDFELRDYVPYSGWPISHEDLRQWYPKAAEHLLCGSDVFQADPIHVPREFFGVRTTDHERWASEPRIALAYKQRIKQSKKITLCLNSSVVDMVFNEKGNVLESLIVVSGAVKRRIATREAILAIGGVETTRLMLAVQRRQRGLFGGEGGALGRFYMGHIAGKVADIVFDRPGDIEDFDYRKDHTGTYIRRRFTFNDEAQVRDHIFNIAFWPDNPPFYDPAHRNGALSAIYLALVVPAIGRRFIGEGMRRYHVGPGPHRVGAHLRNLLYRAPQAVIDTARLLNERFLSRPRKPAPLLPSAGGRFALAYHSEQEPNPDSRITLTPQLDSFGLPRVAIDLRFTKRDVESVLDAHRVLDNALRSAKVGHLRYHATDDELERHVLEQATDGYHQVGTTRMGCDPSHSVVDPNLKVHGTTNLYVASSSAFPTTGQANSTFVAVALALRLANHLEANILRRAAI